MHSANELIERIVSSAQIPSGRRRHDIAHELRAHIEDFVLIAREGGHTDEEIERLALANFGDPREIAREFAWVYRRERAIFRISVFLLSTLAAASAISAVVLALQASMAIGLGIPILRVFRGRHLMLEAIYILCTVSAYVGFIFLERLFDRDRFGKAMASLALMFALVGAGFAAVNAQVEVPLFAFVSGVLLRAIQVFLKSRGARIGAVIACFGLFGVASAFWQTPNLGNEAALKLAVWISIGVCCHLLTDVATRLDRALFNGVQEL
jgi:hypothetical protein